MAKRRSKVQRPVQQRRPRPVVETAPVAAQAEVFEDGDGQAGEQLRELDRIASARFELERQQFAAVLDARLAGATWTEIARVLGVSPQAVQQRYHGAVRDG